MTMIITRLFAALGACLLAQPVVAVLDLTVPTNTLTSDNDVISQVFGASVPPYPLTVSLDIIERESPTWEQFTFEVLVSNAGSTPVILPWSDDQQLVMNEIAGVETHEATIGLIIVVPDGKRIPVYQVSIYGSSLHPGTLKTLAPGEAVKYRAPGVWAIQAQPSRTYFSTEFRPFNVRAELSLAVGDNRWTEPVASPAQSVSLRKPS